MDDGERSFRPWSYRSAIGLRPRPCLASRRYLPSSGSASRAGEDDGHCRSSCNCAYTAASAIARVRKIRRYQTVVVRHPVAMSDDADVLAEIRRLLDEHDQTDTEEPLAARVASVIKEADAWCLLAARKDHEIHRLLGKPCDRCGEYLDQATDS